MSATPGVARMVRSSSSSTTPEGTLSISTRTVSLTSRNAPSRMSTEMIKLATASARCQPNASTKTAAAMAEIEPSASDKTWATAARVFALCTCPVDRMKPANRLNAKPMTATMSIGTATTDAGSLKRAIASAMTHTAVTPRTTPLASAASVSARR